MAHGIRYQRMSDKDRAPTDRKIITTLGVQMAGSWKEIRQYLKENYDFQPELHFYGSQYGWCYKYRRKGKTLCVLFPETKAFTVLVTLGKNEIELFRQGDKTFNEDTQKKFDTAYQYHDGKWVYKRVLNKSDLKDVRSLIEIKRKPRGQK